jgi:hypothetical protein
MPAEPQVFDMSAERVFDLLPPIFRSCVAEGCERFSLELPFIRDGMAYATDGIVIVRMAASPEVVALLPRSPERRIPDAAKMFALPVEWEGRPTRFRAPKAETCNVCEGRVRLAARGCSRCDGEGEVECRECGQDRTCPACDGRGTFGPGQCEWCEGLGLIFAADSVAIALRRGFLIGPRYALILAKHGASLYLPSAERDATGEHNPLRFVAGGVEGLLMPVLKMEA